MTTEETITAVTKALEPYKATAAKVVWEQHPEGWKYVISVHGLLAEGVPIVHTKFVLWVKPDKQDLAKNLVTYLHDLNCTYRTFHFESAEDLSAQVTSIVAGNMFGKRIKELSAVLIDGQSRINATLGKTADSTVSVMEFTYAPQFTIVPCESTTFQFKLNVSNAYNMVLDVAYVPSGDTWRVSVRNGKQVLTATAGTADDIPAVTASLVQKMLSNK